MYLNYSDVIKRKHQRSALLVLWEGNPPVTDGFPWQRTSNAENVIIWWRPHVYGNDAFCVLRSKLIKDLTYGHPQWETWSTHVLHRWFRSERYVRHYIDVTRLKSLTHRLFVQQLIENTKTLHCRPFVRGTIRHRRIPFTKWKWCGKRFHIMTSSRKYNCTGCVLIPPAHFSPNNPRAFYEFTSALSMSPPRPNLMVPIQEVIQLAVLDPGIPMIYSNRIGY